MAMGPCLLGSEEVFWETDKFCSVPSMKMTFSHNHTIHPPVTTFPLPTWVNSGLLQHYPPTSSSPSRGLLWPAFLSESPWHCQPPKQGSFLKKHSNVNSVGNSLIIPNVLGDWGGRESCIAQTSTLVHNLILFSFGLAKSRSLCLWFSGEVILMTS